MVDQSNHVKAIRDDADMGEVFAYERAVNAGQIHTDHLHQMLVFQAGQIAFQRSFAATEDHIMDTVASEITERGGITAAAGKEVLINPQNGRATSVAPFLQ